MIEDTKNIAILSRQTNATTRRIKVRLDKIVFDAERYCHRDPDALKPDPLEKLMNSLTVEGQQVPIEGFFNRARQFRVAQRPQADDGKPFPGRKERAELRAQHGNGRH